MTLKNERSAGRFKVMCTGFPAFAGGFVLWIWFGAPSSQLLSTPSHQPLRSCSKSLEGPGSSSETLSLLFIPLLIFSVESIHPLFPL